MYLDPGFGSMIIQLLLASCAVVLTMLGVFRAKIKAFFKERNRNKTEKSDEWNVDDK